MPPVSLDIMHVMVDVLPVHRDRFSDRIANVTQLVVIRAIIAPVEVVVVVIVSVVRPVLFLDLIVNVMPLAGVPQPIVPPVHVVMGSVYPARPEKFLVTIAYAIHHVETVTTIVKKAPRA